MCGYPKWAIRRVKEQISQKKRAKDKKEQQPEEHPSTHKNPMVVLPYIQGTTEAVQWVLKQYVTTAVRPHITLRKLLVSPKDKIPKDKQCGVVYQVPCHNCNQVYIGETGRQLGTRIDEDKKEVEELSSAAFTSQNIGQYQCMWYTRRYHLGKATPLRYFLCIPVYPIDFPECEPLVVST